MTDVDKSLAQVVSAAKRLNEKSDSINETIRRIETALRESNAGLEYWYPNVIERVEGWSYYLGYIRASQDWFLQVREYRDYPNQEERATLGKEALNEWQSVLASETLLLQCPRTIRIAALKVLPYFLDSYADKIKDAVATIERAEESLK